MNLQEKEHIAYAICSCNILLDMTAMARWSKQ